MTSYFDDVAVGETFASQGSDDITREDVLRGSRLDAQTGGIIVPDAQPVLLPVP